MAHVTLSRMDFDARVARAYPILLLQAKKSCRQDAEDVVGDALLHAAGGYLSFKQPENDNGGSFVNWLYRILQNAISDYHRQQSRRNAREISLESQPEETLYGWESRWAALACQNDRQALTDCELASEARLRMRFATLSREERLCLDGRLKGERLKTIGARLKLSKPTVCRRIQAAILKVRAANVTMALEAFGSADLDQYAWKVGSVGTIYHAPPTTGSQLAREKLAALTLRPLRAKRG